MRVRDYETESDIYRERVGEREIQIEEKREKDKQTDK